MRGIPKRSKTVVFIVIFVFFQVLALAIVGLLALRENQEAQAQEARDAVAERGRDALESFRGRATAAVAQQLRETNQIRKKPWRRAMAWTRLMPSKNNALVCGIPIWAKCGWSKRDDTTFRK